MRTRAMIWAVVMSGLSFGREVPGQTSRVALYETWNQTYSALLSGSDCGGKEDVYLNAYKYSIAYYYYRIATLPTPNATENRLLEATLKKAESLVRDCLQVGPSSSYAGRNVDASIAVAETVDRFQPPPGEVNAGANPVEVQRLQNEVEQLTQRLAAAANAQGANQTLVAQLEAYIGVLSQMASDPSGVWRISFSSGTGTTSADMAIVRKGDGFTLSAIGDAKVLSSVGTDASGKWVFPTEVGGEQQTVYLDLSALAQTRTISGYVQTQRGSVSFVGMKLGDPRIP